MKIAALALACALALLPGPALHSYGRRSHPEDRRSRSELSFLRPVDSFGADALADHSYVQRSRPEDQRSRPELFFRRPVDSFGADASADHSYVQRSRPECQRSGPNLAALHSCVQRSRPEDQRSHPELSVPKLSELEERFSKRLEAIASDVDGVVGYVIVDLTTGKRFERRANEPFPTASAIKIGILHELFVQADAGRVALDEPKALPPGSRAGGSGILQRLRSPMLSLRDHALLMILLSDNTSTNVLIDTLGRETITSHMQAMGATGYRLRRRMMDAEAVARGEENVASPADLVVVMDALRTGRWLSPDSHTEAIRIMREYGPTAIRAGVPSSVPVAAKPGGLPGVRTEVAWVDVKSRPYLLCVMTSFLADEQAGDTAITEISRIAYQYFSRLATAGVEGRLVP